MDMEEIDLSKAKEDGAAKIVSHFSHGIDNELDRLAKDHERPSEALCAELYDVEEQIKVLEKRKDKLKDLVKSFKDRGAKVYGSYILDVKDVAGNRTLDKEALTERLTAELGEEEAKVYIESATKVGKPSIRISVKKLAQTDSKGD